MSRRNGYIYKGSARVSTRFPGVYFLLLVKGPKGKAGEPQGFIKNAAKIFVGNVDDIAAFFSFIGLVLASRSEGLSVSLLRPEQRASCGLPQDVSRK